METRTFPLKPLNARKNLWIFTSLSSDQWFSSSLHRIRANFSDQTKWEKSFGCSFPGFKKNSILDIWAWFLFPRRHSCLTYLYWENYEEHCCLTRIIANLLKVNMFNIWQARFLRSFLSLLPFLEVIRRDLCIFVCLLWCSNWQLSFIVFNTPNWWGRNFYREVKFCKIQTEKCKLVCSGWYYLSFE